MHMWVYFLKLRAKEIYIIIDLNYVKFIQNIEVLNNPQLLI